MSSESLHIRSIGPANKDGLIETEFQMGSRNHHVYFKSNDIALTGNIEAFLTLALLPCMREARALVAKEKVSRQFLDAIPKIMNIFCSWEPSLHRVQVTDAIPVTKEPSTENRIGVFFSGGVDSFYTFLKHRNEVTDLILIHGFDIKLSDHTLYRRTSEMVREVGLSFGKHVIEVETNLRSFLTPYATFGRLSHGVALASVGHLLFPFFSRIYIASSCAYEDLFPWGSHPAVDPLWSTESLDFIHDGCEAARLDRVALLSQFEVALQSLRVCHFGGNKTLNCGRCDKCLRTMISLFVVGALDRCTTFDVPLEPRNVLKIVPPDNTRMFLAQNLEALESVQGSQKLRNAVRKVVNRPLWQTKMFRRLRKLQRKVGKNADKYLKRDKRTYDLPSGRWY
jgi:hypothetical protein